MNRSRVPPVAELNAVLKGFKNSSSRLRHHTGACFLSGLSQAARPSDRLHDGFAADFSFTSRLDPPAPVRKCFPRMSDFPRPSFSSRPRRSFLAFLPAAALAVIAGCATAPADPVLEASLVDLRFTHATVFETVAAVEVRLENVSPDDLQVTGAVHRLTVNGISLGRGLASTTVAVPRLSGATQAVEFHLRNFSLARGIQELTRSRVLAYELDSTIYVAKAGGGQRSVSLRKAGQLDLDRLAPAGGVSGSGGSTAPSPGR